MNESINNWLNCLGYNNRYIVACNASSNGV